MGILKALSVRQPWAWLIVHAGKNIENRNWPTKFRGQFLVHASQTMSKADYDEVADWLACHSELRHITLPPFNKLERGGFIGSVEITDCVTGSRSPWFFGTYGFVLRNAQPMPFKPFKGQLNFFDIPAELGPMTLSSTEYDGRGVSFNG